MAAVVSWIGLGLGAGNGAVTSVGYSKAAQRQEKLDQHEQKLKAKTEELQNHDLNMSATIQKINNKSIILEYHQSSLDDHEVKLGTTETGIIEDTADITQLTSITSDHATRLGAVDGSISSDAGRLTAAETAVQDIGGILGSDANHLVIDNLHLETDVVSASTYRFPNVGTTANVVMTEGAQSINGIKTVNSKPVFSNSIKIPSGASNGNVLVSDAQGVGSWTSSSSSTGIYGDGSDGDVVASSGTLTRDMYYRNLTIPGSVILNTGGYRIFVSQTLTFTDSTSIIRNNGENGAAGSMSAPGSGGFGAPGVTVGGGSNGGAGDGALAPSPGSPGDASINVLDAGGSYFGGGQGMNSPTTATLTGNAPADGGTNIIRDVRYALRCRNLANVKLTGGAGGTGAQQVVGVFTLYGSGGGGGGGVVMVAAKTIVTIGITKGKIQAVGGNGGIALYFAAFTSGAGGGGGGMIVVVTGDSTGATQAIDLEVSGGVAPTPSGGGGTGTNGLPGLAFIIVP